MQSVNLISDARYSDDKANTMHAVKTDQLMVDGVYLKPGQGTGWVTTFREELFWEQVIRRLALQGF